eukprot:CAMPEP_0194310506 /NCGR_PEP_ID=MMETSP0171-20130528/7455_1 /TAXON_ID=218684 /ORGANISM="Corethron pennatum, Strain L29A3" /LENGTH=1108 /DNA_ID=CAMNT_0039064175 /DNA_START=173 /DNA_END=3499 /DNA_ORIENTATION=+
MNAPGSDTENLQADGRDAAPLNSGKVRSKTRSYKKSEFMRDVTEQAAISIPRSTYSMPRSGGADAVVQPCGYSLTATRTLETPYTTIRANSAPGHTDKQHRRRITGVELQEHLQKEMAEAEYYDNFGSFSGDFRLENNFAGGLPLDSGTEAESDAMGRQRPPPSKLTPKRSNRKTEGLKSSLQSGVTALQDRTNRLTNGDDNKRQTPSKDTNYEMHLENIEEAVKITTSDSAVIHSSSDSVQPEAAPQSDSQSDSMKVSKLKKKIKLSLFLPSRSRSQLINDHGANNDSNPSLLSTAAVKPPPVRPATNLGQPDLNFHVCCKSSSTVRVLRAALNLSASSGLGVPISTTSCAASMDENHKSHAPHAPGRMPLAILATNENLREREGHRRDMLEFVADVAELHPEASITIDPKTGHVPFVGALARWVDAAHITSRTSPTSNRLFPTTFRGLQLAKNTKLADYNSRGINSDRNGHGMTSSEFRQKTIPKGVVVTPEVEWNLRCLSAILSRLVDTRHGRQIRRFKEEFYHQSLFILKENHMDEDDDDETIVGEETRICNCIVSTVASIPCFVKTMLLIDDSELRERLFSLPLIRRVILSHHSIGTWLAYMLKERGEVTRRAVAYICHLSSLNVEDMVSPDAIAEQEDIEHFEDERTRLYVAVEGLENIIPSMLSLDDRSAEKVATASIVRKIMDRIMTRPFAMSFLFFDIFFVLILIVAFRMSASEFLNDSQTPQTVWTFTVSFVITIMAAWHFFVREYYKALSLREVSKDLFWDNFFTFWNLIDVSSLVMFVICSIWMILWMICSRENRENRDSSRPWIAITTLLLWLKFLNVFKVVNQELATVVLAIVEISKDIIWFLIILFIIMLAFSQMFHTILSKPNLDNCNGEFCTEDWIVNFFEVYYIMLGFGDMPEDKKSAENWFMFPYTLLVMIVLLNVLIAIISDSYDKARINSEKLFGRARIIFVAELTALEKLLQPRQLKYSQANNEEIAQRKRSYVFGPLWLSPMSYLFLHNAFNDEVREEDGWVLKQGSFIHFFMRRFLGAGNNDETCWVGRSNFMIKQTSNVVGESEQRTRRELRRYESKILNEMNTMEKRMVSMIRQEAETTKKK